MKKLEKLTEKQRSRMKFWRDEGLRVGLATGKVDRKKAELACINVYKTAGLKPPNDIYWSRSPIDITPHVRDTQKDIKKYLNDQVYGAHDSYWLAYYMFFYKECGIESCKKIEPLWELAKNCGWWAPYDTVAILQERPIKIKMENKKLHCEDGPSIEYEDGFSIYSLWGVTVRKKLIETPNDEIDTKEILAYKNAEERMIAMKYIGIERFLKNLNYKVLDEKKHSIKEKKINYKLLLIDLGNRKCEFLQMQNATEEDRIHIEGVPPGTKTVTEALGWRAGLKMFSNPKQIS